MNLTPLVKPDASELARRIGTFTKEGFFALLDERRCFRLQSGACELLDLEARTLQPLGISAKPYPGAVVAAPDGSRVAIAQADGSLKVITLREGKKPASAQLKLGKLTAGAIGFVGEDSLVASAYESLSWTEGKAVKKQWKTASSAGVVISRQGTVAWSESEGAPLELRNAPFEASVRLGRDRPLAFSDDGNTLLVSGDEGVTLFDVAKRKALGKLSVEMDRSVEFIAPLDAERAVCVRLARNPSGDQQTVTVERWSLGKARPEVLKVSFDANKKQAGLAERVALGYGRLVLNSEAMVVM